MPATRQPGGNSPFALAPVWSNGAVDARDGRTVGGRGRLREAARYFGSVTSMPSGSANSVASRGTSDRYVSYRTL